MLFEFDPEKDKANIKKHGISLVEAELLDWHHIQLFETDSTQYAEVRTVGYGHIGKRLHCIVFTYRGLNVRIISLRKANKRERKKYET